MLNTLLFTMLQFLCLPSLSFMLLNYVTTSSSMPNNAHNLVRRQCSGAGLTVLEGSPCDEATQAYTLACSDNCYDVVSLGAAIRQLMKI